MKRRSLMGLGALAITAFASACQANQYPNCGAFEFGDLETEPVMVDEDASPVDCEKFRVQGQMTAPMVSGSTALDCALEHLVDGSAMHVEIQWSPDGEYSETATIWSDEDGVAMRWRRITNDLSLEREARVFQLDTGRLAGCQEHADAGERFSCLYDAFDDGEVVKTCDTARRNSE